MCTLGIAFKPSGLAASAFPAKPLHQPLEWLRICANLMFSSWTVGVGAEEESFGSDLHVGSQSFVTDDIALGHLAEIRARLSPFSSLPSPASLTAGFHTQPRGWCSEEIASTSAGREVIYFTCSSIDLKIHSFINHCDNNKCLYLTTS